MDEALCVDGLSITSVLPVEQQIHVTSDGRAPKKA